MKGIAEATDAAVLKPKLRIGILVDSLRLRAWEMAMLDRIRNSDYAEVAVVVVNAYRPPRKSMAAKVKDNWKGLAPMLALRALNAVHSMLESKFTVTHDAFALGDARGILGGIECLEALPIRKKYSDSFQEKDLERIPRPGPGCSGPHGLPHPSRGHPQGGQVRHLVLPSWR